ncbi:MAG: hypothetical protein ACOCU6_02855 [Nanoarchaeota archaeon]
MRSYASSHYPEAVSLDEHIVSTQRDVHSCDILFLYGCHPYSGSRFEEKYSFPSQSSDHITLKA